MTPSPSRGGDSALASLAIIKVNFDRQQDYIENFIPFVAEALRVQRPAAVSLSEIQACVHDLFGLRIPQGALSTVLRRASRKGLVNVSDGVYSPSAAVLSDTSFRDLRASTQASERYLVERLAEFASSEYGLAWSLEESERALLQYVDQRSAVLLSLAVVSSDHLVDAGKPLDHADVIVGSFIARLRDNDRQGFEFLMSIVKGTMLANVLYLPGTFDAVARRFGSTQFDLDTAFVLRAAGFASNEAAAPCVELVDLLNRQDAKLCVFEHTLDELTGVLDSAVHRMRGEGVPAGPSEFLVTDGWSPSDVEQFANGLRNKLAQMKIEIISKPAYSERLGIDEVALTSVLVKALPGLRTEGVRRDVDSLTAIHRLRGGNSQGRLESSEAVFVTTNGALVWSSTDFLRKNYGGAGGVPWCIHAHTLTTLAWLKEPTASPELPKLQVIADCFAALNPPEELWTKYRVEIDRLAEKGDISADDCHLLRYSDEARRALMLQTMGDSDVFAEGTVAQVLERARANARADTEVKLEAERTARSADAETAASQLAQVQHTSQAEIAKHEQEVATAKKEAQAAAEATESARVEAAEVKERHTRAVERAAQKVSNGLAWLVVVVVCTLVVLTVVTQIGPLHDLWEDVPVLPKVAAIVVIVLGAVGLVTGWSATSLKKPLQRFFEPRVRRVLDSLMSSEDKPRV